MTSHIFSGVNIGVAPAGDCPAGMQISVVSIIADMRYNAGVPGNNATNGRNLREPTRYITSTGCVSQSV